MEKLARLLTVGLSLYTVIFGLVYAARIDFMPHHYAVIPAEISSHVLPLYLVLMRLAGAAIAVLGVVCLYVVVVLRESAKGGFFVVCLSLAIFFGAVAYTAAQLQATTDVVTHWGIMLTLCLLAVIGLLIHGFTLTATHLTRR